MSDSYYPAHASLPLEALEIWDNDDRPAIEQWREWFQTAGAGWKDVACIECELGRPCLKTPPCVRGPVKCICPEHADRVDCIDLRYHGYAPGPNSEQPRHMRDECECVCHSEKEERERDEEDADG